MIYELMTIRLQPGMAKRAMAALKTEKHKIQGELLGVWTTDVGNVNDVVLLNRYVESDKVKYEGNMALLSACLDDSIFQTHVEAFTLFPGIADPKPGEYGPLYEMRVYLLKPGRLDQLIDLWSRPLLKRLERSAAPIIMYSMHDGEKKFVHIWTYNSFDERNRIRKSVGEEGWWPPAGGAALWKNLENTFLVPAEFSPMR